MYRIAAFFAICLGVSGCISANEVQWSNFRLAYSQSQTTGELDGFFGKLTILDFRTRNATIVSGEMRERMRPIWSPDGNLIAFRNPVVGSRSELLRLGENSQVYLYFYDLKRNKISSRKSRTKRDGMQTLAWGADGKTVFYSDWDNNVLGYSIENDSAWIECTYPKCEAILALNLSHDGRLFGLTCVVHDEHGSDDLKLAIFNRLNKNIRILDWASRRTSMGGWSPQGHCVIVYDSTLTEYDYDTGEQRPLYVQHDDKHFIISPQYAGQDTFVFLASYPTLWKPERTDVGFCTRLNPAAQWLTTDKSLKDGLSVYYDCAK